MTSYRLPALKLCLFLNGENYYEGCVVIDGHRFTKGRLRGKDVVLTNISIVNATMVTQLTLDKFRSTNIIFSGVAGGIGGVGANDDISLFTDHGA